MDLLAQMLSQTQLFWTLLQGHCQWPHEATSLLATPSLQLNLPWALDYFKNTYDLQISWVEPKCNGISVTPLFLALLPPRGLRWCARTSWCPRQDGTTRRWGVKELQLLGATAGLKRRFILSIFFLISNGCCEAYWANVCKLLWNSPMSCARGMLSIAPRGLF